MRLTAANLTLGDLGPVLTTLSSVGDGWEIQAVDFRSDTEALRHWEVMGLVGGLEYDDGRLWMGCQPASFKAKLSPDGGDIALYFGDEPDSFIVVNASAPFLCALLKDLVPRLSQETPEQSRNNVAA